MIILDTSKAVTQRISTEITEDRKIELFIKRDDLIDPQVSGNKWRKLKYNLLQMQAVKSEQLVTFGGAFSNHLLATAALCNKAGIKCTGIVRGEELNAHSNEVLRKCHELGMNLHFVSRTEYALRNEKLYQESIKEEFPNCFIVPEGGANYWGAVGCQEILMETSNDFDHVFVAVGTGTTSLGLLLSKDEKTKIHAVPVLKGFDAFAELESLLLRSAFSEDYIEELLQDLELHPDAHFGGYGKYDPELLKFMQSFYAQFNIPLDPVYTGKAMYALFQSVHQGKLDNARVLFIHTGGIEGGKMIQEKEGMQFS